MADLLSEGLGGLSIDLSSNVVAREEQFIDELLRWNSRVNLTSIRERDEALEKHLLDSLVLLKYLPTHGLLLDMGSGGGLPGIPLAIACPELQVVSVDSVGKKISFQKHVRRLLGLDNLQPINARLEVFADKTFDFVTARALSSFSSLTKWAAPLQKEGGQLLVMKGPEGAAELQEYLSSDNFGHYAVKDTVSYNLPFSGSERQIIILTRNLY